MSRLQRYSALPCANDDYFGNGTATAAVPRLRAGTPPDPDRPHGKQAMHILSEGSSEALMRYYDIYSFTQDSIAV